MKKLITILALALLIAGCGAKAEAEEVTTFEVVDGKGKIVVTNTEVNVRENLSLEDMGRRLSDLEREKVNVANETVSVKERNDARIVKIDTKIKALKGAIKLMPVIVDEIK